jgi:TonB-linked SusC/RagA family outer membrane protein
MFMAKQNSATAQPDHRITLDLVNVSIADALHRVVAQAGLAFDWSQTKVPLNGKVTVSLHQVPIQQALQQILHGTGAEAKLSTDGQTVMIVRTERANSDQNAATGRVAGRVVDSANSIGLHKAVVSIEGSKLSTVTSDSGYFGLKDVPAGDRVLSVRLFGYKPVRMPVTVHEDGRTNVRVIMSSVATVLSGVVTTATGVHRKIEVGNDITTINVDSVMKIAPISTVTDLLETRVPGLTVLHSSGSPGDPSRIRIRGASSITGNNDPIVIVDGVRVYAAQSDARNSNLAPSLSGGTNNVAGNRNRGFSGAYATPSPLDQIDPNSIESIDVLKGPSATSLYGSDAANGVIIITTKHGRAGPTHWSVSASQGASWVPGKWPINYYRFGQDLLTNNVYSDPFTTTPEICVWYNPNCNIDSVVAFQALNDSRYTVFAHGSDQQVSLTGSGGVTTLLYSFTGTAQKTSGNLKLPGLEIQRYEKFYGPIPHDLVRPDQYNVLGGTGQLTAQPSSRVSATWTSSLLRSNQQRSSLEQAIGQLQGEYINPNQLSQSALIQNEYERATDHQLSATNAVMLDWQALSWLRLRTTGGLNTIQRTDESYIPYGVNDETPGAIGPTVDTTGWYGLGKGSSQVITLTMGTTIPMGYLNTAVGINYQSTSTSDVSAKTSQLAPGVSQPTAFPTAVFNGSVPSSFSQATTGASTYGWYIQPTLHPLSRLYVSPGFRLDGGSASGSNAGLTGFPKIDFSYIAIDQDHPVGIVTLLRPRLAFGYAGTQPNPVDKLRIFNISTNSNNYIVSLDGGNTQVSTVQLSTLGNTQLRLERTGELEGGLDVDFWNDRLQLTYTMYDKVRHDAILAVPVPPSVSGLYGTTINKNIGEVRNTGNEVTLNAQVFDIPVLRFSTTLSYSSDNNRVVRLNPGQSTIVVGDSRVEVGYPLWSQWARPIVVYADANNDGIISYNEIRLGDSAVFVGQDAPKYKLDWGGTVSILNGQLSVTTSLDYQHGITQLQKNGIDNGSFENLPSAPGTSLATQAAVVAAGGLVNAPFVVNTTLQSQIGMLQTVNVLRLNSLSINYVPPTSVIRSLHVPSMSIVLQGSNLGLHTNYRGLDPNVNAFSTSNLGESIQDSGQLPQPRTWRISVRLGN